MVMTIMIVLMKEMVVICVHLKLLVLILLMVLRIVQVHILLLDNGIVDIIIIIIIDQSMIIVLWKLMVKMVKNEKVPGRALKAGGTSRNDVVALWK